MILAVQTALKHFWFQLNNPCVGKGKIIPNFRLAFTMKGNWTTQWELIEEITYLFCQKSLPGRIRFLHNLFGDARPSMCSGTWTALMPTYCSVCSVVLSVSYHISQLLVVLAFLYMPEGDVCITNGLCNPCFWLCFWHIDCQSDTKMLAFNYSKLHRARNYLKKLTSSETLFVVLKCIW